MSPLLGQSIVKMEKLSLGQGRSAVKDAGARAFEQERWCLALNVSWPHEPRARAGLEDMGKVGLAAAWWSVNCQTGARPGRPAVEPCYGRLVAGGDQEILVLIGRAVP